MKDDRIVVINMGTGHYFTDLFRAMAELNANREPQKEHEKIKVNAPGNRLYCHKCGRSRVTLKKIGDEYGCKECLKEGRWT